MTQNEITKSKYRILCGIIWSLTILISAFFLGENGLGYFCCAYETFFLLALFMLSSMPETLSKMMRSRAQKNIPNAEVYKSAFVLSGIYALIGSLLLLGTSDYVSAAVTRSQYSSGVIRAFIPAYIMFCLSKPLKGYFNGQNMTMPDCISSLISALVTLVSSPFLMVLFGKYGNKVAELLHNTEFVCIYMAYGMAVSFFLGFFAQNAYLFFAFFRNRRTGKDMDRDPSRHHMPSPEVCIELMKNMLTGNLRELILRSFLLGSFAIYSIYYVSSEEGSMLSAALGAYYGKYISILVLITLLIRMCMLNIESQALGGIRRNEHKFVREKLNDGIHMIICIAGYNSVAFVVLGFSLLQGMFKENNAGTGFFTIGGFAIILLTFVSFFMDFILFTNKKHIQLIVTLSGLLVGLLSCFLLCRSGKLGLKALSVGFLIYLAVIVLFSAFVCVKSYRCNINYIYHIIIPVTSSLLVGVIIMLLNKGLVNILNPLISFVICYILGALGHTFLLLALHNLSEEELVMMPGGRILIKVGLMLNFFS